MIMRESSGRARKIRGTALAEFGMAVTVFLMLTVGISEFARALYDYDFVCYAARAATRYAMVNGSTRTSPATAATVASLVGGMAEGVGATTSSSSCSGSPPPGSLCTNTTWTPNNKPGSTVQVTVTYYFNPFEKLVSWLSSMPLSSTAQAVVIQ